MLNVAICGIGRAGQELIRSIVEKEKDMRVAAGFCRVGSERAGKDIGLLAHVDRLGIEAMEVTEAGRLLGDRFVDVVIDFSNPAASKLLLAECKKYGVPAVVCTTGFTEEDLQWMRSLTKDKSFGLVYAPNVTLGVNVLIEALKLIAQSLPFYDFQITETHHNRKADIPSGTAKIISQAIENELSPGFGQSIPINSVRAGGHIGIHEVMAAGENEEIVITHQSFSRRAFAEGALRAARFISRRKGWHEMSDVILSYPGTNMQPLQMVKPNATTS